MRKTSLIIVCILCLYLTSAFAATVFTTDADGNLQTDFSPGDVVYIHGTGFLPSVPVIVNVTWPSNVTYSILNETKSNGKFLVPHYITGEIGIYYIIASDGTRNASTTFTDAAIWTTRDDCGNQTQNVNQYAIGQHVFINADGFAAGNKSWFVKGQPGGASCDPDLIVASGNKTVNASGSVCFDAYTVQSGDCGEYRVLFDNKNDNYRVINATNQTNQTTPCALNFNQTGCQQNGCFWCPTCSGGFANPYLQPSCVDSSSSCTYNNCSFACGAECTQANAQNNVFCPQDMITCQGNQTALRDSYGNCDGTCGCSEDPLDYACLAGLCGATCDSNEDCGTTDCDYLDGCVNHRLQDCSDATNTCGDACGCTNQTCSSENCQQTGTDVDQDGYDAQCGDCNDYNQWSNPEAEEYCDHEDNDCDGLIDEGFDADEDGVSDCFDNCPYVANPDQKDEDGDGKGDVCDECPKSLKNEIVDQFGCDAFQFCSKFSCGQSCVYADFLYDEPQSKNPFDCTFGVVEREGILMQPKCIPLSCQQEQEVPA